uniref:Uncharacterized protein n=1 Tax=Oryza glumipatula TaxID=40148 RepID=A0A0D9Y240_9ORYZ
MDERQYTRISSSYPLLKTGLSRFQLQILKAFNCFLKTLNCHAFVPSHYLGGQRWMTGFWVLSELNGARVECGLV